MRTSRALALTAVSAGALALAGTASAADWFYYGNSASGREQVGRVQVDGSGRADALATLNASLQGLASNGSNVFAVSGTQYDHQVDRLDASGAKTRITASSLCASAPNSARDLNSFAANASYLYYICEGAPAASQYRYLGRISFDGATRDESFVNLTNILTTNNSLSVDANYAYFLGGTGFQADHVYRVSLTAGATATAGPSSTVVTLGMGATSLLWGNSSNIGRFANDFPTLTSTTLFVTSGMGQTVRAVAASATNAVWQEGNGPSSKLRVGNVDGSGAASTLITPAGMGQFTGYLAYLSESAPTPDPTPTPAPAPAAAGPATVLRTPTETTTPAAEKQGCVQVTVPVQLAEIGKYTFIYETVTSTEMSRDTATSSKRIAMQKGSRVGKKKLAKTTTAAVITTTEANAKVVLNSLLKKAQAKKWNLRVIHTASDGSQSQSIISK